MQSTCTRAATVAASDSFGNWNCEEERRQNLERRVAVLRHYHQKLQRSPIAFQYGIQRLTGQKATSIIQNETQVNIEREKYTGFSAHSSGILPSLALPTILSYTSLQYVIKPAFVKVHATFVQTR
jgi:hypothetical protein